MNLRAVLLSSISALSMGSTLLGQQPPNEAGQPPSADSQKYDDSQPGEPSLGDAEKADTNGSANNLKAPTLKLFGSWRFRAEAWDWFQPTTGENAYTFVHSLLRAGLSQTREHFEWLVEGAQDAILGLPGNAIASGNQGQLGLGGTYFVGNQDRRNIASGFLKQAYVGIGLPLNGKLTVGRFGFSDGTEVKPTDATLTELVNTRVAQRLIGEFNHSSTRASIFPTLGVTDDP